MRILVLAYACEPYKGSEPGAGWMWCRLLARLGDVTVITRANNREAIESAAAPSEASSIHFEYVDLPEWARRWKRGRRGIRLYYLFWQFAALRRARVLNESATFDLAWHVTLANAWLGSALGLLGVPFVLGPVSGGVRSCWRVSLVGMRGLIWEVARSAAKTIGRYLNPLARLSWARAKLILTNNEDTLRWLPRRHLIKMKVFPNVILEFESTPHEVRRHTRRRAIYAGELLPLKGVPLALHAIKYLQGWNLDIYGEGSDRARLQRIALNLGIQDRVRFHGWVSREELFRAMAEDADVLLFPSLHDEAGWVVVEAQAHGLPVICLDRGGPKSLGGRPVHLAGLEKTGKALAWEAVQDAAVASQSWALSSRFESLHSLLIKRNLLPSARVAPRCGP